MQVLAVAGRLVDVLLNTMYNQNLKEMVGEVRKK